MNEANNESFKFFLKDIFTYDDLQFLTSQIDKVIKIIYVGERQVLGEKLSGQISKEVFETILNLEKEKVLPVGLRELQDYFIALNSYLRKIPKIVMTIAFDPSSDFCKSLSFWFEKTLGYKIVLEIIVKEEIIGGLIVEYRGKYKDYSKAGLLNEVKLASL